MPLRNIITTLIMLSVIFLPFFSYCEQPKPQELTSISAGASHKITNRECNSLKQFMSVIVVAGITAGVLIVAAVALSALPEPISKAIAAKKIAVAIVVAGAIYASIDIAACNLSFVLLPVRYAYDESKNKDRMIKRTTPPGSQVVEYEFTDKYHEAVRAPYSDRISMGYRAPNVFAFMGNSQKYCYRDADASWGVTEFKADRTIGKKQSTLCPEEAYNLGAEIVDKEENCVNGRPKNTSSVVRNPGYGVGNGVGREGYICGGKTGDDLLRFYSAIGPVKYEYGMEVGDETTLHTIGFKAIERGNKICIRLDTISSQLVIGCHKKSSGPPAPMCDKSQPIIVGGKIVGYNNKDCFNCFISQSCFSDTGGHSKSFLPLTSTIVECIKDTLDLVVNGCYSASNPNQREQGMLQNAQKNLKNLIQIILVLSVIFYAFKIIASPEQLKTPDAIMYIIKFAIVIFLTSDVTGGMTEYSNYLFNLSQGLSAIILKASAATNGLCAYEGYESRYSYLAIWDSLDCRLFYYLGAPIVNNPAQATAGTVVVFAPVVLIMIIALLFSFEIVLFLLTFAFAILIIALVIWVVNLFILSLISLSIVILVSPIFIPMVMFQYTKSFFDGWLKELIAYSLYPIMLFSFVGFIFAVLDNLYFGTTEFESAETKILGRNVTYFFMKDECDSSAIGCILNSTSFTEKELFLGMRITAIDDIDHKGLMEGMLLLMGFVGLFLMFMNVLIAIAGELAGGSRSAMALADKVKGPGQRAQEMMSGSFGAAKKLAGIGKKDDDKKGDDDNKKDKDEKGDDDKDDKGSDDGGSKGGDDGDEGSKKRD